MCFPTPGPEVVMGPPGSQGDPDPTPASPAPPPPTVPTPLADPLRRRNSPVMPFAEAAPGTSVPLAATTSRRPPMAGTSPELPSPDRAGFHLSKWNFPSTTYRSLTNVPLTPVPIPPPNENLWASLIDPAAADRFVGQILGHNARHHS